MMRPYSVAVGSPPRVWGRRRQRWYSAPRSPVHPHACGEDTCRARHSASQYGSPPRVWGRPDCAPAVGGRWRFTPTRVGKTNAWRAYPVRIGVHPHACGEDWAASAAAYAKNGSPPRVWGRPSADSANTGSAWFTPTRVGKTPARRATGARSTVHPHACGEDAALVSSSTRMAGSPPRVWGRLVGVDTDSTDQRFTPTRVGKTLRSISCMLGHCCRGACISPRSSLSAPPRRLPRALPSHRWAAAHPTGGTPKPARHGRPACD